MGRELTDEVVIAHTGTPPPIQVRATGGAPSLREQMNAAIAAGYEIDRFWEIPNEQQAEIIALYRVNRRIEAMSAWWARNRPGAK